MLVTELKLQSAVTGGTIWREAQEVGSFIDCRGYSFVVFVLIASNEDQIVSDAAFLEVPRVDEILLIRFEAGCAEYELFDHLASLQLHQEVVCSRQKSTNQIAVFSRVLDHIELHAQLLFDCKVEAWLEFRL